MTEEELIAQLREEISEAFIEFRLEQGWSRKDAAFFTEVPYSNLTRLETATTDIYLGSLQKIAHAYGYGIEIGFVPLDEPDISEGETHGEDPYDVPEESGGPLEGAHGGPSGLPVGA